ncbi:MAG: hypothetical protein Q9225_003195, partial [Loekoesia sp. 1 TL-2023]
MAIPDKRITSFALTLTEQYATPDEWATLLPSHNVALRCVSFFQDQCQSFIPGLVPRIIDLIPAANAGRETIRDQADVEPMVSAVIYPKKYSSVAKSFWQHSGEGISSRQAELCHRAFIDGFLVPRVAADGVCHDSGHSATRRSLKGPLRYQKGKMVNGVEDDLSFKSISYASAPKERRRNADESAQFVEERYGRNLDFSLAGKAKLAIRRRIAGGLTADVTIDRTTELAHSSLDIRQVPGFSEDDVYLFPSGMSSIFNTHRIIMACRGEMRSVCFGFPYIDTLKILEKWGPGCQFYGNGSAKDLDDLESRCQGGERFLALFCEFPGNPLLKCPDLSRIRALADRFDFAVVVDETIGNFLNIHVLPQADVVVSSLTKVFSGDSNVMGGSRFYDCMKRTMDVEYEDNYWAEDALFMERNSRDFVSRIARINTNAEAICNCLKASAFGQLTIHTSLTTADFGAVNDIYYPKYSSTRHFYDQYRKPTGGYGGLLSVTFRTRLEAVAFYDALETAKGPSLGTNFTL